MSDVAPDAAPTNSTFAQRAAARGVKVKGVKQITPSETYDKALGAEDEEITDKAPPPVSMPVKKARPK